MLGAEREWTWAELDAEVDRAAGVLHAAGIGAGGVVAVLMIKRPEVVVAFLACARVGAIYVPVNFKLHPDQVADQFSTAGVNALVLEHAFEPLLKHLMGQFPDPRRVLYVDGPGRYGEGRWEAECAPFAGNPPITADTVVYYNYTSGSTGRPKGAVTTHRQINANAVSTAEGRGFLAEDV